MPLAGFCCALHQYKPSLECPSVVAGDPTASGWPCVPCTEIAVLDQEIEETEKRLRDLAHKRVALKQQVNESHDPLTSRLHPKMIGEIFGHYVDIPEYSPSVFYPDSLRDISSPLTLAAVCTAWRRSAFSTPRLWASIHVHLPYYKCSPDAIALVESWVGRAGLVPLSIVVISNPENMQQFGHHLLDLGNVIDGASKYASSWKRLLDFLVVNSVDY